MKRSIRNKWKTFPAEAERYSHVERQMLARVIRAIRQSANQTLLLGRPATTTPSEWVDTDWAVSLLTRSDWVNIDWLVSLLRRAADCRKKIRRSRRRAPSHAIVASGDHASNEALLEELRLIQLCGRRLGLSDAAMAGLVDCAKGIKPRAKK